MSPTRNGWRNLFLDFFFYDFPLLICKLALESDYVCSQEDSRESTEARPDMFASQNKAAREEFFVHFLCAKRHGKHVDKRRKSLFQVTVFALEIFFFFDHVNPVRKLFIFSDLPSHEREKVFINRLLTVSGTLYTILIHHSWGNSLRTINFIIFTSIHSLHWSFTERTNLTLLLDDPWQTTLSGADLFL